MFLEKIPELMRSMVIEYSQYGTRDKLLLLFCNGDYILHFKLSFNVFLTFSYEYISKVKLNSSGFDSPIANFCWGFMATKFIRTFIKTYG